METIIEKDYKKATKDGRLYISTEDFFKQKEIQDRLKSLKKSSIYKTIERNNKGR